MKFLIVFLLALIYCDEKATVYFTKTISSERMVDMFKKLNVSLTGKVGLKVHSGEPGDLYFLKPKFLSNIYNYTNGTFLECNTAYTSVRSNSATHKQLLEQNGWFTDGMTIDLMDENPDEDLEFPVPNYKMINTTYVGSHLKNYDSCVVLSHFKGHQMGGYGGALKQLSIGFASQKGKMWIHSAGRETDISKGIFGHSSQEEFTNAMGDAASVIVNYFKEKGQIVYINVLANISTSCDCAGTSAPAPKIKDIGIMASTDPVAIDKASLDLIKQTNEEGTKAFLDQVGNLLGENTIFAAEKLGIGTTQYNLINIDNDTYNDTDIENFNPNGQNGDSIISYSLKLVILVFILFCN